MTSVEANPGVVRAAWRLANVVWLSTAAPAGTTNRLFSKVRSSKYSSSGRRRHPRAETPGRRKRESQLMTSLILGTCHFVHGGALERAGDVPHDTRDRFAFAECF